ncbi:hypothetical protein AO724_11960 [Aeromonas allosaccharophila]|uniref:NAD-dependent epimerase/dehydratase family protein n=1 Tax=Aeromonas allosaccharophila TaxID=656 RepID=UPI0007181759|nr:NAD-dependent epimerase/dehydratase family protein [Aeromonas allosaccharophila]KRW63198.1 hypothetical protein AO724_11960 [Aeromonas allosaccharophila]
MNKRVFLTGAAGYIGGSLARHLDGKGYQIRGLVRKEAQLESLEHMGAQGVLGTLEDTRVLEENADWADIIINTADYEHMTSVETFLRHLAGSEKTYMHVSGSSIAGIIGEVADPHVFTEDSINPRPGKTHLHAIHKMCLNAAEDNIKTIVIVPSLIYGPTILHGTGFFSAWANWSKDVGFIPYLGQGENIWSNVHIDDLMDLFVLAIERAPAGSVYFAENGELSMTAMANLLQKELALPNRPRSLPRDQFVAKWGDTTTETVFGGNSRVNSQRARMDLSWTPKSDMVKHAELFLYRSDGGPKFTLI